MRSKKDIKKYLINNNNFLKIFDYIFKSKIPLLFLISLAGLPITSLLFFYQNYLDANQKNYFTNFYSIFH